MIQKDLGVALWMSRRWKNKSVGHLSTPTIYHASGLKARTTHTRLCVYAWQQYWVTMCIPSFDVGSKNLGKLKNNYIDKKLKSFNGCMHVLTSKRRLANQIFIDSIQFKRFGSWIHFRFPFHGRCQQRTRDSSLHGAVLQCKGQRAREEYDALLRSGLRGLLGSIHSTQCSIFFICCA